MSYLCIAPEQDHTDTHPYTAGKSTKLILITLVSSSLNEKHPDNRKYTHTSAPQTRACNIFFKRVIITKTAKNKKIILISKKFTLPNRWLAPLPPGGRWGRETRWHRGTHRFQACRLNAGVELREMDAGTREPIGYSTRDHFVLDSPHVLIPVITSFVELLNES